MERAQLGPPMVHMTKFDQIRLKDLGARRVDDRQTDRHTDTQTDNQTQARIRAILRIGPKRAQLGPPMVHMAKFDQNRLKDLGARRLDDRQTHRHTDKPAGDDGPILPPFISPPESRKFQNLSPPLILIESNRIFYIMCRSL